MAITDREIVVKIPPVDCNEQVLSMYSADLSDCEELMAAVSGKCHYISKITIYCASAITISIGAGETSDNLTTTYIGPIEFTTASVPQVIDFGNRAMQIPIGEALCIDASGSGVVNVVLECGTGSKI